VRSENALYKHKHRRKDTICFFEAVLVLLWFEII